MTYSPTDISKHSPLLGSFFAILVAFSPGCRPSSKMTVGAGANDPKEVPAIMLGHVVLQATVQGHPARLVLDPVDGVILDAGWAARNGIATVDGIEAGYGRRTYVGGAGADRREARFARDVDLTIGHAHSKATRLVLPLDSLLAQSIGHEVDGLVGLTAFGDRLVHVQPNTERLGVLDRAAFKPPADARALPVRFDGGLRPIVSLELELMTGVRIPVSAYFDLGMSGNLRVSTRFSNRLALLSRVCREGMPAAPDNSEVGLGGALESVRISLAGVWMGAERVDTAVTATVARELDGADAAPNWDVLVGWGLMRRFEWWIDARGQRLWYRPIVNPISPGSGDAGISFRPISHNGKGPLIVGAVSPDGAAAAAGIVSGDRIASVDNRAVRATDAELLQIGLSRAVGRTVAVTVERGSRKLDLKITPRETLVGRGGCAVNDSTLTFRSDTGPVVLAGTYTRPATPVRAAAVLVSVAGPDERDMAVGPHRLLGSLAESLAHMQVSSLRFDDRGVGGSGGSWLASGLNDRSLDVCGAVRTLRTIHPDLPIGVIGMSEGGGLALLAERRCGPFAFVGLLSAPLQPGGIEMRASVDRLLRSSPVQPEMRTAFKSTVERLLVYLESPSPAVHRDSVSALLAGPYGAFLLPAYRFVPRDPAGRTDFLLSPWYLSQVRYDVTAALEGTASPLFGVYGRMDQVIEVDSSTARLARVRSAEVLTILEGHNHVLQRARTGAPTEYATLPEGISAAAMEAIARGLDRALAPREPRGPR